MHKTIQDIGISTVYRMFDNGIAPKGFLMTEHGFITRNALHFFSDLLKPNQPYRVEEGRAFFIMKGCVRCFINLQEFCLKERTVVIVKPGSIFELIEKHPGTQAQAFTLKDIQQDLPIDDSMVFLLEEEEWRLACEHFDLIYHTAEQAPTQYKAIMHLCSSFLILLYQTRIAQMKQNENGASRNEYTFHRFLDLVKKHGDKEHNIAFYADKLCVTPNHLGAVIRKTSGLTVMQWIYRHIIQQAKSMLRYTGLPVWDIAERLHFSNSSFFCKFFKKETGLTPKQYRERP